VWTANIAGFANVKTGIELWTVRWSDIEAWANITGTEVEAAADVSGSDVSANEMALTVTVMLVATNWGTGRSIGWRNSWSGDRWQHLGVCCDNLAGTKQNSCGCCDSNDLLH
jgi:hypothetical protein